jgi:hypothetical protein
MSWPPPERLWRKVAENLPAGTDILTLKAKVHAVAGVYLNDESGETAIYAAIHKQLRGLEQLDCALESLRALPMPFRPPIVDQVDLQSLYELRAHSKGRIAHHKYNGAKRHSDGRLYFNLLWILTAPEVGLPLSDSDCGPTTRVFKILTDHILKKPKTFRAIREIIRAEIASRAKTQH